MIDGKWKTETKRVTHVSGKTSQTAANKAFRIIGFHTKYDHWKFKSSEEVIEDNGTQLDLKSIEKGF